MMIGKGIETEKLLDLVDAVRRQDPGILIEIVRQPEQQTGKERMLRKPPGDRPRDPEQTVVRDGPAILRFQQESSSRLTVSVISLVSPGASSALSKAFSSSVLRTTSASQSRTYNCGTAQHGLSDGLDARKETVTYSAG